MAIWSGPVLRAAKLSGFTPFFKWLRYESRRAKARFPIVINTKSVKCSIALAVACVILELNSIRNCNSSAASDSFFEALPLFSSLITLSCACMSPCTLNKQRLKLAVWLHTTEASLAVLSQRRSVSCEILREAGGVAAKAAFLAILPKLLFSLAGPVCQLVTVAGSNCWSE